MRVVVKNHALPVYKKNRIASLLCIFESTIYHVSSNVFYISIIYMVNEDSLNSRQSCTLVSKCFKMHIIIFFRFRVLAEKIVSNILKKS